MAEVNAIGVTTPKHTKKYNKWLAKQNKQQLSEHSTKVQSNLKQIDRDIVELSQKKAVLQEKQGLIDARKKDISKEQLKDKFNKLLPEDYKEKKFGTGNTSEEQKVLKTEYDDKILNKMIRAEDLEKEKLAKEAAEQEAQAIKAAEEAAAKEAAEQEAQAIKAAEEVAAKETSVVAEAADTVAKDTTKAVTESSEGFFKTAKGKWTIGIAAALAVITAIWGLTKNKQKAEQ